MRQGGRQPHKMGEGCGRVGCTKWSVVCAVRATSTRTMTRSRRVFPKMEESKDPNELSKLLEELTGQLRECKRLMKEFGREIEIEDHESRITPELNKLINMMKKRNAYMLNKYVDIGMMYTSSLGNKRLELFDGVRIGDPVSEDNVFMASAMSNKEFFNARKMDETDQANEHSEMAVEGTMEVGAQTAVTLGGQAEKLDRSILDMIICFLKAAFIVLGYDTVTMVLLFLIFGTFTGFLIAEIVDPFGINPPDSSPPLGKFSSAQALGRFH